MSRPATRGPLTVGAMASALASPQRSVERWLAAGMPRPSAGETAGRWRQRAGRWLAARARERAGRRPQRLDEPAAEWLCRWRAARARRAIAALARLRAAVHDLPACAAGSREIRELLAGALAPVPAQLAGQLPDAATSEALFGLADDALRLAVAAARARGAQRLAEAEREPAAPVGTLDEPPAGASDASEWWLARRRRAAAEAEELRVRIDSELHAAAPCERERIRRTADVVQALQALPARWGRSLLRAGAEQVLEAVGADIAYSLGALDRRDGDEPDVLPDVLPAVAEDGGAGA